MSVAALNWAFDQSTEQPVDKLVLLALADYADEDGECHPSRPKLAKRALCSVDTVDRSIKRLIESGLVEKHARTHEKGGPASNIYRVCLVSAACRQPQDVAPPSRKMRPPSQPQNAPTVAASDAPTVAAPDAARVAAQDAATGTTKGTIKGTVTETVSAREGAPDGPDEIPGLNGSTSLIITTFAQWVNPWSPDLPAARKTIADAVGIYGDRAVRDGFAELKADVADGRLRVPTVKSFYGYCRQAKDRSHAPAKAATGKPTIKEILAKRAAEREGVPA